ncbi:hypothetical protein BH11PAT2_BH11PAT2_09460 [soil metagenome]
MIHSSHESAQFDAPELTFEGVDTALLIFLSFAKVRLQTPEAADLLVSALETHTPSKIYLFSLTRTSAVMACKWLGIERIGIPRAGDLPDHYPPSVMTYRRDARELIVYEVATDNAWRATKITHSPSLICFLLMPFPTDVQEAFS